MTKEQALQLLLGTIQQLRIPYQEHLQLQKALAVLSGHEKENLVQIKGQEKGKDVSDKRSSGPNSKT